ncbi:glycogen/starch/alpha-glucan phosphorylase [Clostridium formicaceticum]|uniref:Alpha-1,4 glucan phosphorylase n=1 Tax=Clostridium formicaceticum TaxID=1497 RepID=A0AAC9WJA3_9CLOT|nr:glycogen/starch/alpha-glucan phosphorylase [Clostridium formicaceticum]AOY74891.1 glycogen phosphorylase [Clostridium formicaceticum]ARE89295.1 Glycogen phosphorylase [Clostridium formicaceticum]
MRKREIEVEEIKNAIELKLETLFGRNLKNASKSQLYKAVATALRDDIMRSWAYSKEKVLEENGKELYYLSMEFLMGRFFHNNLTNLMLEEKAEVACNELGIDLKEIKEIEPDAGLGNGGLGRLAACFLDSLATLGLSGHGNGIRYEYGLFKQKIIDGYQVEMPDPWLEDGNVWEVAKPEEPEMVYFGGTVEKNMENGRLTILQKNCQCVKAIPYDVPIVGYKSNVINTLRLWGARALKPLDMGLFGKGQYVDALAEKELAEVISKVLYPEDNHEEGRHLRLKQQYFFISASIQSIVRKFKKIGNKIQDLHKKTVIHINDTHPTLAIPELMRILIDQEGLDWEKAWGITTQTFAYTNHTTLPEALEKWPEELIKQLLPRIYDIIHEINERFCRDLWEKYPGQWEKISKMAIISYGEIHMAKLCIVGSFSINGVAKLHSEILKRDIFKDFYEIYPSKFINITNGVTHRRFLLRANPDLADAITAKIGDGWITDSFQLKRLETSCEDAGFQEEICRVRQKNKEELAKYILDTTKIKVDLHSIFDVQVKRLHEYKRQLLNVLHIMYLYNQLLDHPNQDMHPKTFIFAAKAAPGYHKAKLIIKLIHSVADKINNDRSIYNKLKLIFLENYRVSLAEKIIPAADISKQISTAGKEASGTGNMKFMLNGTLTVGTLDGANIEMNEQVGPENIFIFGSTAEEIENCRKEKSYYPHEIYKKNDDIKRVVDQLINGFIEPEHPDIFREIYHDLLYGHGGVADPYFILKDFASYCHINKQAEETYKNPKNWWKKSIINIANAGYFSSDRTIEEYNEKIWKLKKHDF